jgi:hypothetical protein
VSGGTRSDTGRDCRDAFLSLNKTCAKLRIAFWDYLGARLAAPNQPEVPYLPTIVQHRSLPADCRHFCPNLSMQRGRSDKLPTDLPPSHSKNPAAAEDLHHGSAL